MLGYIARRLVLLVPILFALSLLVFLFVRALPGTPADALLGERGTEEDRREIIENLGLDQPLHVQYGRYLSSLVQGNLGQSVATRQPVSEEFARRFPATFELSIAAMIFAIGLGIPLGYVAAKRYQGVLDNTSLVASLIGVSIPVFFLALLLKYVFAVKLGWLPSLGRISLTQDLDHPTNFYVLDAMLTANWPALLDVLKHLVLPAVALGTIPLAIVARITRAATLDVLSEDYVRTAHSKGLDPFVVDRRHVLRNAMLPVVTVIGLQTGLLLTGAVLTETIFSWPGLGTLILNSIRLRDYAVLQGGVLLFAVIFVIVNLVVDISYAFLNPRIRYR